MSDEDFLHLLFSLSIIYALLFLSIGVLLYLRYKPLLGFQSVIVISLSLINILLKVIGFSIIEFVPMNNPDKLSTTQVFATLTSSCFLLSFQAMTVRLMQ